MVICREGEGQGCEGGRVGGRKEDGKRGREGGRAGREVGREQREEGREQREAERKGR